MISQYRLIVFTAPVDGREDDYNAWYNDQHLQDVVAIPGVRSAQRFKLRTLRAGHFGHRYLAIYEIDGDLGQDGVRIQTLDNAQAAAFRLWPAVLAWRASAEATRPTA